MLGFGGQLLPYNAEDGVATDRTHACRPTCAGSEASLPRRPASVQQTLEEVTTADRARKAVNGRWLRQLDDATMAAQALCGMVDGNRERRLALTASQAVSFTRGGSGPQLEWSEPIKNIGAVEHVTSD